MSELSPEDAESIIEAAAAGRTASADPELSAALGSLHDPMPLASGEAPAVGSRLAGTARYARRTAAVAAIGVMSLVGVAAAGTAGIVLLADDDTEATIGDDLDDDTPASTTTTSTTTSTTTTTTTTTAAPVDEVDDDDDDEAGDDERERGDEIEGVDASDGLDDDELEKLCEAAVNHGEYVSAVARDKETEVEGARGQRVSEAAQSDCGKVDDDEDGDDDGDDESGDDDADDTDDEDGDDDGVDHTDGPGNNGNGKAKGHERNGKSGADD